MTDLSFLPIKLSYQLVPYSSRMAGVTRSVVAPVVIVHDGMMMITSVVSEITAPVSRINTAEKDPIITHLCK